jgi:phage terminase large subunit GpA-like protein
MDSADSILHRVDSVSNSLAKNSRIKAHNPNSTIAIMKVSIGHGMYKLPCPHCGTGMALDISREEVYVSMLVKRKRLFCSACARRYPVVKVTENSVIVERMRDGEVMGTEA